MTPSRQKRVAELPARPVADIIAHDRSGEGGGDHQLDIEDMVGSGVDGCADQSRLAGKRDPGTFHHDDQHDRRVAIAGQDMVNPCGINKMHSLSSLSRGTSARRILLKIRRRFNAAGGRVKRSTVLPHTVWVGPCDGYAPMGRYGYARVSTTDQDHATQTARLRAAGCEKSQRQEPGRPRRADVDP